MRTYADSVLVRAIVRICIFAAVAAAYEEAKRNIHGTWAPAKVRQPRFQEECFFRNNKYTDFNWTKPATCQSWYEYQMWCSVGPGKPSELEEDFGCRLDEFCITVQWPYAALNVVDNDFALAQNMNTSIACIQIQDYGATALPDGTAIPWRSHIFQTPAGSTRVFMATELFGDTTGVEYWMGYRWGNLPNAATIVGWKRIPSNHSTNDEFNHVYTMTQSYPKGETRYYTSQMDFWTKTTEPLHAVVYVAYL